MRPGRLLPGLDFCCLHSGLPVPAVRLSCLRCERRRGGSGTRGRRRARPAAASVGRVPGRIAGRSLSAGRRSLTPVSATC